MSKYHISTATIARTAVLLLALTNQVLSALGKPVLPIESATVEQLVTTGLTVAAALAGWWKNNSFTPEAIEADGYPRRPLLRISIWNGSGKTYTNVFVTLRKHNHFRCATKMVT